MARGLLYIELEGQGAGTEQYLAELPPLRLLKSTDYETAEKVARAHWKVSQEYSLCFVQYDERRKKSFAIPQVAWSFDSAEDEDLQLFITKRADSVGDVKEEKATPILSTATTAAQDSSKLPSDPKSTSPRHSPPPPPTQQPLPIDDDGVVPATPELSSDDEEAARRRGSLDPAGGQTLKGNLPKTRAQSRTFSREKLAAVADGERLPSPKSSSSGRPFPSLPTASSVALSPLMVLDASIAPHDVFSCSSGAVTSSQETHPIPPRHQHLVDSSQNSFPSSSAGTDRSLLAGRGRHDAVSPFRGDMNGSEEERKADIRWGKQREGTKKEAVMTVDPAVVMGAPAQVPSHSPRRSSVGSDFCIGLIGDELAFVARSPERTSRPPITTSTTPARFFEQPHAPQAEEEDTSMEEERSFDQIVKEEPQSSPNLFRKASKSDSGSGSSGVALKHHSSASGINDSLEAFPLDAQVRQSVLQHTQPAPPPPTSPRGTKRKEAPISTPRSSPRRVVASTSASGLNKRPRIDAPPSSAPQARTSYLDLQPLGKKVAPKGRASLLAMPSATQARSSPASSKKKASTSRNRPAPATPTRHDYAILNAAPRADLPPAPSGARKSARWHYKIRFPYEPLAPRIESQFPTRREFIYDGGAVNSATYGLTLAFIFDRIEKVSGWKRRDLRLRCLCVEKGSTPSQETREESSAPSGSGTPDTGAGSTTQASGTTTSSQDIGPVEMVERSAWGWDDAFIGFRDLEEWGFRSGACFDVDYFPYSPSRAFDDDY